MRHREDTGNHKNVQQDHEEVLKDHLGKFALLFEITDFELVHF